jgi:hypothetical protein
MFDFGFQEPYIEKYICSETKEMLIVYIKSAITQPFKPTLRLSEYQRRKIGISRYAPKPFPTTLRRSVYYKNSTPIDKIDYEYLFKEWGIFSYANHNLTAEENVIVFLNNYLNPNSCYITYEENKTVLMVDNTGRSLMQIVTEGYRGNRLDIMVKNYSICLNIGENKYELAKKKQNSISINKIIQTSDGRDLGCAKALAAFTNIGMIEEVCERN